MVRKSDRTKSKDKVETEKAPARKVGRPPKRKKKSESDSEPEPETKEVGDIPEPNEGDPQSKASSRRSARHHRNPTESTETHAPESENPEKKNKEWEEDPNFWGQEDSAPAEDSSVAEEATTWKIQSSNGSGGEIQKLKICRQRVANDSNDPSSPAKDSPRRKKKSKHSDENAESGGDVSSSNEAKDEAKPDDTLNEASLQSSVMSIILGEIGGGNASNASGDGNPPEGSVNTNSEEVIPQNTLDIPIPGEDVAQEISTVSAEVEVESSSRRGSQEEGDDNSNQPSEDKTESVSRKPSTEDRAPESSIGETAPQKEEPVESKDTKESGTKEEIPGENKKLETEVEKTRDRTKSESSVDVKPQRIRTKSENSEDGKGEKKLLLNKVKVNSEEALDEIAKKLNERAARFAKDESKEKEKRASRVSTDSIEPPKSPREEGELTPEQKKSKHTTIIINRPKEIISKPTRLKRTTDEIPPAERKRRVLLKSKSRDKRTEEPINISADTLMRLVPEVKTITSEQVAAFPLDDEELTRFEMDDEEEHQEMSPKMSKKKIVLKAKEVEIRVENDTRQVTKKRPIVFDKENVTDKPVGPKLPNQENHRVVRRISLVDGEATKKPRRSPSPGAKNQTEVLFITNLVRPFTVPQLRELLARTGTIAPNGFYIDKIKSKCYVKYTDVEMAVETRHALNGVRWPVNNPKTLKVEFVPPEQMTVVQQMAEDDTTTTKKVESDALGGWLSEQAALKPQRKVTTAVREWDMGKIGAGSLEEKRPLHDWRGNKLQDQPETKRRATSPPVKPDYEPPARKIKKRDNDAPAKLLDDLFRKTKTTPCIYWLPLTATQIAVKEEMRRQHLAENERRLAELRKTDHTRRDNRDRDREKSRDRRKK